jgi:hypothetical protein
MTLRLSDPLDPWGRYDLLDLSDHYRLGCQERLKIL